MVKKGKVLAEWRKESQVEDGLVDIRRKHYAVREDGVILEKSSVHFHGRGGATPGKGSVFHDAYWHSWGWKRWAKVKTTVEKTIASLDEKLLAKGFERIV